MAIERADIVERVAERLKIAVEGGSVSSADRVTIENACDDVYAAVRNDIPLSWTLDDIPAESVMNFTICVAALAASPTNAPDAAMHEAKYDSSEMRLKVLNRLKPQNHIAVTTEHF